MNDNDLADRISRIWQTNKTDRPSAVLGAIAVVCVAMGWIAHSYFWRHSDIDYAYNRALQITSACKGLTQSEVQRNAEARVGSARSFWTLDQKLIAMDYLFDRLEVSNCISPRGR